MLRFTGRTRYFLSAFGEHLISEEVEKAIAIAADTAGIGVIDFHVGPVFPTTPGHPGRHRWFVEFTETICPDARSHFERELDVALSKLNEDYLAHRVGNVAMGAPEVCPVPRGGFADWMRSRDRLGGQNKVPRMDNSGHITDQLARFFHVERDA